MSLAVITLREHEYHSHGRVAKCTPVCLPVCLSVRLSAYLSVSLFACLCMLSLSLSRFVCVSDFCWNSKDLQILVHSFGCVALKQLRSACLQVQPPEESRVSCPLCSLLSLLSLAALVEPIKIYGQVIFKADTCRQHKNVTSSARAASATSSRLTGLSFPAWFHSVIFFPGFTAPQRLVCAGTCPAKCLFCCVLSHCICLCVFHIARFLFISLTRQKAALPDVENAMKLSIQREEGQQGRGQGSRRKCA